jgi:hypothetical protein
MGADTDASWLLENYLWPDFGIYRQKNEAIIFPKNENKK